MRPLSSEHLLALSVDCLLPSMHCGNNMTDYTELKKLAEAATPGPWLSEHHQISDSSNVAIACVSATRGKYEWEKSNRDFIAAACPTIVLQMLSHISELERRVAELQVDADRYRYLRQGRTPDAEPFVCIYSGSFSRWTLESCDSVVDSAIAHQSNNRG